MKSTETSVTFHADKQVMADFDKAAQKLSVKMGVELNRKQAFHIAFKVAIAKWNNE